MVLSLIAFLYTLTKNPSLDFQSASATANIVVAFFSTLLATITIYTHLKINTASYKLAENIYIDIIKFRNINLKTLHILKESEIKIPTTDHIYDEIKFSNQENILESHNPEENEKDPFLEAYKANKLSTQNTIYKKIANNLSTSFTNEDNATLGYLAAKILPTLKFLTANQNSINEITFEFSEIEKALDLHSFEYEYIDIHPTHDGLKYWMKSTSNTLLKIELIISNLYNSNSLNIEKIENHLLNMEANRILEILKEEKEVDEIIRTLKKPEHISKISRSERFSNNKASHRA